MKKLGDAGHRSRFGITAREGTKLGELTDECFVLSCGSEEAVAATKSVVEQALVYHSILCNLIDCQCPQNKGKAADLAQEVMQVEYDPTVIEKLAAAKFSICRSQYRCCRRATLKTNEITRKRAIISKGPICFTGWKK